MRASSINGRCRDIYAGHTSLWIGQGSVDGKTTSITEAIQDTFVAGILTQRLAFIALIQKKTCLLSLPEINTELHPILANSHTIRLFTRNNRWLLHLQSLTAT